MEIKDLTGLSKPLEKLVDAVSQGVGAVSRPYFIRKNADARAYEMKQLADAKAYEIQRISRAMHGARELLGSGDFQNQELSLITPEELRTLAPLPERAASRVAHQDSVEQQNIEEITSYAAEELMHEETVSSEPVDPDWIKRFFDMARHVSHEEMQVIWGKILAGEIKQPETYSLRTLELLRNLSRKEAETFVKAAKASIFANYKSGNISFIFNSGRDTFLEETFDIKFPDLLLLKELGMLTSEDLSYTITPQQEMATTPFVFGDTLLVVETTTTTVARFNIYGFTRIGQEMLGLVEPLVNMAYIQKFSEQFFKMGWKVKYGKISSISESGINTSELQELESNDDDIDGSQSNSTNQK